MQCHLAYILGLCLFVSGYNAEEIADMTHICANRSDGELVPHPTDCQAYFTCALVPKLHFCETGLHFDVSRSICDSPDIANCTLPEISNVSSGFDLWAQQPKPVFMAIDVDSGEPINPMDKYDPKNVECRHFGAYFLPHPRTCQLYFICAYGHLHSHHCGNGTRWNYKKSECQPAKLAECYSNSEPATGDGLMDTVTVSPDISPINPITVCYIVGDDGTAMLSTPTDNGVSWIQSNPTSTTTGLTTSGREESSALVCPKDTQAYLPHPEDCTKYYICIIGKPVLTSCPKGLYWDQKSGYCDLAKYVKCFQQ